MSVFPLILKENYKKHSKGQFFEKENGAKSSKLYKILGFKGSKVYAVRILRKTRKPSTKQPIFEVFNYSDI